MLQCIGILNFDGQAGRWVWDVERSMHMKTSRNVAEVRNQGKYRARLLHLSSFASGFALVVNGH
jgi:hypothetical protein